MKNWFVLFVRNGSENYVIDFLKHQLDGGAYEPFILTKTYPHISGGKTKKVTKPFFPGGYVFLRSDKEPTEAMQDILPAISASKDAYRLLFYGDDKGDIAVRPEERGCIERLLDYDFNVDGSYGFMEGDAIRIIDGPLTGMESRIKKINKRKRTAIVELDFVGARREVVLMLEILEKQ